MTEAVMELEFGMFDLEHFVSYLSNRIAQKRDEIDEANGNGYQIREVTADDVVDSSNSQTANLVEDVEKRRLKELRVDEERDIEELFDDADEVVLGDYGKRRVGYLHSIRRFLNGENVDLRGVVPFSWSSFYYDGFIATLASVVGLPREKPIGEIEVEKGGFNLSDEAGDNGYEEIRVYFNKQVKLSDGRVIRPGLVEYRRECSDGVQYHDLFRRDYEFKLNIPGLRRLPGMKRRVDLTAMLPREAFG